MLNRSFLPRLLALVALVVGAGVAGAQDTPAAPTAVRVRIAHLAPFAGSDSATITVKVGGAAVGGTLAYGDHTSYQGLAAGPGTHTIQVMRDGAVAVTEAVTLDDGDVSIIVTGDDDNVALNVLVLDEDVANPGPGMAGLRVTHVAAIGATIEATQVDVCSQTGQLFHSSAAGLRYNRTSAYRIIPANTYDLKVTRYNEATPCAGTLLIDPPPITLGEGTKTTFFLVGDGPNQPLAAFTFEQGLIGDGSPTESMLYLPAIRGD
jgi:hypothetical protein